MTSPVASYRLETPRPRPPPLPIRSHNMSPSPSRLSSSKDPDQPLLYDLPSAVSMAPTYASSRVGSPISPTNRSQSRASRGRRMTPPPTTHSRAPTPSRPLERDLETFAELCRSWYYQQDDNAGRLMTQTLATLPSSHRAPFARLQASIRSAYHVSVNARRNAEFQAHLRATIPGGSLMPHSRADPAGPLARKERHDRFERFVRTWCTMGMPGTKPFFEGLWAVMRLSVIPIRLGGAGGFRIEWEIDDAVFKEAAGKDFMLEAIDVLKGVLAFEENASKRSPSLSSTGPYSPFTPLSPIHSRSQSSPLPSDISVSPQPRSSKVPPIASTTSTKRPRAPSDPFLDSHTPTPPLSTSYSSNMTMAQLSTFGSTADGTSCPPTPQNELEDPFPRGPPVPPPRPQSSLSRGNNIDLTESPNLSLNPADAEGYLRTWTAPDLPNAEFLELLKLFPSFVVQNPLPRFPMSPARDLEAEAEASVLDRAEIRVGTGTMWLGTRVRSAGWRGGWWTRFRMWLRTIFC